MRRAVRVGLTAAAASAATVVGLAISQWAEDYRNAARQVLMNSCKPDCKCQCGQKLCACHGKG